MVPRIGAATRRDVLWSIIGAVGGAALPRASAAAAGRRTVAGLYATDPVSGLALRGFDPVSYFLPGGPSPQAGRPGIELRAEGVDWRFANAANREAFRAAPGVYRPRLCGFDPVSVARGALAAGDPLIPLVTQGRLYLFRSVEERDGAGPDLLAEAEAAVAALVAAPE